MTAVPFDQVTMLRRSPAHVEYDNVAPLRDGARGGASRRGDGGTAYDQALLTPSIQDASRPHGAPSYLASLVDILPILPMAGTTTTVFAYIGGISPVVGQSPLGALLIGGAAALILALVTACLHRSLFTSAEHAHPRSYAEIRQRVDGLAAQLSVWRAEGLAASRRLAFEEAAAHLRVLERDLARGGPQWIIGTGYVDALTRLHRAEEALVMVQPAEDLLAGALFDELRVAGSTLPDRERLLGQLRAAIQVLRPAATPADDVLPLPISSSVRVSADAETRISLRDVRRTLNDFRDESRARLIRSRSRLLGTMTLTGVITYILLALAISLSGSHATGLSNPIITAAAIYLVGAVVGMFNRLYAESADDTAGEDYGLSKARLLLTPILSGLAAVGGVLVTGMVTGIVDISVLSPAATTGMQPGGPTGVVGGQVIFSLRQIFNLSDYPFSLMLAAMFGLAPKTFLTRLQRASEQSHLALQSTTAR